MKRLGQNPWDPGHGEMPSLQSKRLCLRPFTLDDVEQVTTYAGDARIARMTKVIPHPYAEEDARVWIGGLAENYRSGLGPTWAVVRKDTGQLMGCVGIAMKRRDQVGLLGYWTGVPFWRQGYTLEAAATVVAWAHAQQLPRLSANVLAINVASRRILLRLGFLQEGILRADALRDGERIDVHCYGLLLADWIPPALGSAVSQ